MALELGVVPESITPQVVNNMITAVKKGTHSNLPNAPTGGIVFTKYFWDVMKRYGNNGFGIEIMEAKSMPSFDFWLNPTNGGIGATTLWENWQSTAFVPHGSYNHIMYGGFGRWMYAGMAGITRMPGSRGWNHIRFSPALHDSASLTAATASVDTPKGVASIEWTTKANTGSCGSVPENKRLHLFCSSGTFTGVVFASFGTPSGTCGNFTKGSCDAPTSVDKVHRQ